MGKICRQISGYWISGGQELASWCGEIELTKTHFHLELTSLLSCVTDTADGTCECGCESDLRKQCISKFTKGQKGRNTVKDVAPLRSPNSKSSSPNWECIRLAAGAIGLLLTADSIPKAWDTIFRKTK